MSAKNSSRPTGATGFSVLLPLMAGAVLAGVVAISRSVRKDREAGIRRPGNGRDVARISAEKFPQDTTTSQLSTVPPSKGTGVSS